MKKSNKNLYFLYMLFGVVLVTANCMATKVFDTGIALFGSSIVMTVGVISYPFTFLITDCIGELWSKEQANEAVMFGFICQVVSTLLIVVARYMPAVDSNIQVSYVNLLGQNWVFVLASLSAYLCSQTTDVFIFHRLRTWFIRKDGHTRRGRWIYNNVGTITSQLLDSSIYVIIAFGFGFRWLFDSTMYQTMFNMILGQWLFKSIIAFIDTPVFVFLTRKSVYNNIANEKTIND